MLRLIEKIAPVLFNIKSSIFIFSLSLMLALSFLFPDFQNLSKLNEKKERLDALLIKKLEREEKRNATLSIWQKLKASDPLYLEKNLFSINLGAKEKERLKKEKSLVARKRLKLLKKNKLEFISKEKREKEIKETELYLVKPILADEEEIVEILSVIEDLKIGHKEPPLNQPQLIIKNLSIVKKEGAYEFNIHLWKRELL